MKPFKIKDTCSLKELEGELSEGNFGPTEIRRKFIDAMSDGKTNPLSLDGLKFLSNEELLGRYIEIDNGAARTKWHICWLLRQRFDSNILFGKYIDEFKSSVVTLCYNNRMSINRAWRAGKFCESNNINDIAEFKLSKTVIYELSAAANEDVATQVFEAIKERDTAISVQEAKRLLMQARAIEISVERQVEETELSSDESDGVEIEVEHPLLYEEESESDRAIEKVVDVVRMYQDIISIDALIRKLQSLGWN